MLYTAIVTAPRWLIDARLALNEDANYCPVRATMALLGQKWVPRIIYELMQGKRRFNELASVVGGCNSRTLRDRLKGLEDLGILERTVITQMPPWVEYNLTPKGRELGLALRKLEDWGRAYMAEPIVQA
jgi:DNA-binding HxlR family transcriptional regulator